MARYDAWFAMQKELVDNGTACSRIVLEGPDGSAFGTWPIGFPSLEESCEGMLQSLRESLPKGRHQCRLVAFDSQGATLSQLPVVVVGASDAATEAGQGRLQHERANSIFIANADKQIASLMRVLEHQGELLSAATEANAKQYHEITRLIESTQDSAAALRKDEGRERRLDAMLVQLGPLIGVAAEFAAAFATDWLQEQQEKRKTLRAASAGAALPVAKSQDGEQKQSPTETASEQPSVSCPTGTDSPAPVDSPDGEGRTARDGGVPPTRDRSSSSAKDSERRRPNKRRRS